MNKELKLERQQVAHLIYKRVTELAHNPKSRDEVVSTITHLARLVTTYDAITGDQR